MEQSPVREKGTFEVTNRENDRKQHRRDADGNGM